MAIVVKDRVKVSTTTTGTGTITLGSAEPGFQTFSVVGNGNQTYYAVTSGNDFEVGIGTYTDSGTTLSRDTVLESSNSGAKITLAGTSTVFTTYPAERSSFRNVGVARDYTASGSITAGKPLILNADNTVTQVSGGNLTTDNYFGIASSSASDTEAVGVNRPGSINIDQTGLTAGKDYYAKDDGTIVERTTTVGSTTTVNASQFVGTARSSTDLELAEPPIELVGTADGSITKGKPVILKTNGDFEQAGFVASSISYSTGTESALDTDNINTNTVSYDSDRNYFVVFYQETNSSGYGYAKTFTVSNKTITEVQSLGAFHTNNTKIIDACYIGNNKHIVFYAQENDYLEARVVEIASDGTGTFGTANTLYSGFFNTYGSCYYDSSKDVAVITGVSTLSYITSAMACTVSGTTITGGSLTTISGAYNYHGTSTSYDSDQNIGLVAYEDAYGGHTDVCTISLSGTGNRTITFNTGVQVNSAGSELAKDGMTFDSTNKKHLLLFNDDSDNYLKGIVISVSGTTPSVGTESTINSGQVNSSFACQFTDQGTITVVYRDHSSPNYLKGAVATISSTSFSLTNQADLNGSAIAPDPRVSIAYQPSDFTNLIIYVHNSNDDMYGICTIPEGTISATNVTATNFIGFAQDTVADNEDVKVATTGQTDDNQSSLTTASQYYVQTNGTLSTTAGTPSVLGGTALSSTKILIKS